MADVLHLSRVPVFPPTNGRERRIYETARKLSEYGEVWLASPGDGSEAPDWIHPVPVENPVYETKLGFVYLWHAALLLGHRNPFERFQAAITWSRVSNLDAEFDLVVSESPQTARVGRRAAIEHGASLLVNKHNAQYALFEQFLDDTPVPGPVAGRAVDQLRAQERLAIEAADAVVFQSGADPERFDLPDETPVRVIPNGTGIDPGDNATDAADARTVGADGGGLTCVFLGSYDYTANRQAATVIDREIAPRLPAHEFLLVGREPPQTTADNVTTTGYVEDLPGVLASADVALCPLQEGSGTKLKMLDYLAAGLPVVTTSVGASGIDLRDGESALVRETPEEFAGAIRELGDSPDLRSRLAANARHLGERYTWDRLMNGYDDLLADLLDSPTPG